MASRIPSNAASFSRAQLLEATSAELLGNAAEFSVRGITTDSRADVQGKLFVALVGEHFDGHAFVASALEAGAAAVLVEREVVAPASAHVLRVPSTLSALGQLARAHRRRWGGQLVAVAGSAGKTTTRSAISGLLRALHGDAIHSVPGNLNNAIGVPMVLFGLEPKHRAAVVELGTNQQGEIASLTEIAEPDLGVLTLIDWEHAQGIGDLDAVEAEEGALLAALPERGAAVFNGDDPRVRRQAERSRARRRVSYGTQPNANYRLLRRMSRGLSGSELVCIRGSSGELRVQVPLLGDAGAYAALAAIAVADCLSDQPITAEVASRAFASELVGEPGRLCPIGLGDGSIVIDDSYNANPISVKSSALTARELAEERGLPLYLVVGEMRELGEYSAIEHDAVGEVLRRMEPACLIAVGGDARRFIGPGDSELNRVFVEDAEGALRALEQRLLGPGLVLVKASRGVGLERIVEGLLQSRGRRG